MRINVYSEELTQRVELVHKGEFVGVRFYMELPVAMQSPPTELGGQPGISHIKGPFVHHAGDDDSAAVTFWGKREFRKAMVKAIALIDQAEGGNQATATQATVGFNPDKPHDYSTGTGFMNDLINAIDRANMMVAACTLTREDRRILLHSYGQLSEAINKATKG